jgi:hypothetical protein
MEFFNGVDFLFQGGYPTFFVQQRQFFDFHLNGFSIVLLQGRGKKEVGNPEEEKRYKDENNGIPGC